MSSPLNNISYEHLYCLDENGHLLQPKAKSEFTTDSIVFVPSEQLLLVDVFVPGKKTADWKKALPFVLEEQLSQPVEQLFFAVLHRENSGVRAGHTYVAVVEKEKLENWTEELKAHNLQQAELVADVFILPFLKDQLQSLKIDNRTLVRIGEYKGLSGTEDWVEKLLDMQALQVETTHSVNDCFIDAKQFTRLQNYSIRQAGYAVKKSGSSIWKQWFFPFVLVVAIVLTFLAGYFVETETYKTQQQAYKQQTEKLFKQLFPNTKRIVNIRAQTKSKLAKMMKGKDEGGVAEIIETLEPLLLSDINKNNIKITAMAYKKQQLTLFITAKNVSVLQAMVEKVSKHYKADLKLRQLPNQSNIQVTGELYVK